MNNSRIRAAIQATQELVQVEGKPSYWDQTLASRQPNGFGSRFLKETSTEEVLSWNWEPYPDCPNPMEGCSYYRAPISGILGVVRLMDLLTDGSRVLPILSEEAQIGNWLKVSLTDPKSTGKVTPEIERSVLSGELDQVDFTVMILGDEGGREVVFTFHPGDPIRPSSIPSEGRVGSQISINQALDLGLEYAKIQG